MILRRATLRLVGISCLVTTFGQAWTTTLLRASKLLPSSLLTVGSSIAITTSSGSTTTTCRSMSLTANSNDDTSDDAKNSRPRIIRMLALHGSEGNADNFAQRMEPWKDYARQNTSIQLDITTITAPVPKGRGYAWWSMPPFVRSYNATTYEHFAESEALVLQQLQDHGPFDVVMGFSQGAILSTSLLALQKISERHAGLGFILVGGAWPNPYTQQLESLGNNTSSSTDDNNEDAEESYSSDNASSPLKDTPVLIVAGTQDSINPPEQSERVRQALKAGGCPVTMLTFEGGHVVPRDGPILQEILEWMKEQIIVDRMQE